MREKIARLARGLIDLADGTLVVSEEGLECCVKPNQMTTGVFCVSISDGIPVKGVVYSTHRRVKIQNGQFYGLQANITYEIDSRKMDVQEEISGEFVLVTNAGERKVPFCFCIAYKGTGSVRDILSSIDSFADLASREPATALSIFDSTDFLLLPFMKNLAYATLYRGLIARGIKRSAMEEFLTGCGVKERIRLKVDETPRIFYRQPESFSDVIEITRSVWGYLELELAAEGSFIEIEKHKISEDDFLGNTARIPFMIHSDHLYSGKNSGRITIKSIRESFSIDILITALGDRIIHQHLYEQEYLNYVDLYLNYLSGRYEERLLLNSMQTELSRLRSRHDSSDLIELFHAEVFLLQERREQAALLIEDVYERANKNSSTDMATYCFYTYIKAKYDDNETALENLSHLLNRQWELQEIDNLQFFLLLLTDDELKLNPSLMLARMKEWFHKGGRSPFVYWLACRIFNEQPDLLRVIEPFELQTMNFGCKRGMLKEKAAARLAELAPHEKSYRRLYHRLLEDLYESYPICEVLVGILTLLIKGDFRGSEYFIWYERGVSADIRLTNLYEYYLYALPEGFHGAIPRRVLLYFSYHNTLDYETQAILYSYILTHLTADEQLMGIYHKQIEAFALDQMFKGHISYELADIYRTFIFPELVDEKAAKVLPKILAANCVLCDNPTIKHVVVLYEEIPGETIVPLWNQKAYVPIYLDKARILMQDAFGNRFESIPFSVSRLLSIPKLTNACYEAAPHNPYLLLHECIKKRHAGFTDDKSMAQKRYILENIELTRPFKQQIYSELIDYFYNNPDTALGEDILVYLNQEDLGESERVKMTEMLIARDYIEEGYQSILSYGYEKIKPSRLMKLCSRMILKRVFEFDEALLALAFASFLNERADDIILEYLCRYFNGSNEDMYSILLNAASVRVDMYDFIERLFAQLLFTEDRQYLDQVFVIYVEAYGNKTNLSEAYLTLKSYWYFMQQEVFQDTAQFLENKLEPSERLAEQPEIWLMAMAKWYSELEELTVVQVERLQTLVRILYRNGYIFAFFQDLSKRIALPDEMSGKIIIEYHGERGETVMLKLLPDEEDTGSSELTMTEVLRGYYVKMIPCFYGETLYYEIYRQAVETPVQKGTVEFNKELLQPGGNRISMLNRSLAVANGSDTLKLKDTLIEYAAMDALVKLLFKPL